MAKQARIIEQEFLANIVPQTGHNLATWMETIQASGATKTNAIIKWIKDNYPLNHRQASMLAGIYLNDGQPVHDYDILFNKLFEGAQQQKPLYESLMAQINMAIPKLEAIPTKTYISLENEHVIGCIKIGKSYLRLGLDLGDIPYDAPLQPAKGLGAMPNIAHMIQIETESDITDVVIKTVQKSYQLKAGG